MAAAVLGTGATIGGQGDTERIPGTLEGGGAARSWGDQGHTSDAVPLLLELPVRTSAPEVVSAPEATVLPELPLDTPAPVVTPIPVVPRPEPGSIEALICSYGWECGIALRVFACESGPDYIAGFNSSGHAGTAQISPLHAWRFTARGLDFWTHALVLEWNLEVAYEIWTERWWYAWACF